MSLLTCEYRFACGLDLKKSKVKFVSSLGHPLLHAEVDVGRMGRRSSEDHHNGTQRRHVPGGRQVQEEEGSDGLSAEAR